ncbi:MAG: ABC transporter permease [Pseudomonadota bacterium]
MFRHLLKLIWKRKARNVMLSLEILLAFLIVFAISAFAVRNLQLYRMPIGFEYQDRWSVRVQTPDNMEGATDVGSYQRFRSALLALPEVEQVAFVSFSPFRSATMRTDFESADGKQVRSDMIEMSDEFPALAGMRLLEGRWFGPADDGADAVPVILNRRAARTLFPSGPAVGKTFLEGDRDDKKRTLYKVSGVIEEFRNKGEFMVPVNYTLTRYVPRPANDHGFKSIMLKLKPGTPRTFEAALNRQLKLLRADWGYTISPLADLRSDKLRWDLMPLIVGAVIAAFLLVMVGFGLFGVLWQNTTQRIPEIGLRRALGASAGHIYTQIVAEQMLLSSAAMALALLLLVQLPITGALGESLNWLVFCGAALLSMGVIYLISLLCSLYPGWRASRLSPTQALHYE